MYIPFSVATGTENPGRASYGGCYSAGDKDEDGTSGPTYKHGFRGVLWLIQKYFCTLFVYSEVL
jgi:hypothetical protein